MSYKYDHLILEMLNYTLLENFTRNFWVHCAERVVKKEDISIRVYGSRKADSSFLAARDIDSTLAHNSVFSSSEHVHVFVQLADPYCNLEALFIIVEPEADIVLDRG